MRLTIEQVAELAGLQVSTARELLNKEAVPFRWVGRRKMYSHTAAKSFAHKRLKRLEQREKRRGGVGAYVRALQMRIKNYRSTVDAVLYSA